MASEHEGKPIPWLDWARRLQAHAQSGLAYSPNPFDRERFEQIRAVAEEMAALGSGAPLTQIRDSFNAQAGYATPKIDVRGALFQGDRVLLVRERSDGGFTLPGGYADVFDSPKEAVEREMREESGFEVRAVKLAALYDRERQGHTPPHLYRLYKAFFICELVGGEAKESSETCDAGFFELSALPPLSLGRTTARELERMLAHQRDRSLPADFD